MEFQEKTLTVEHFYEPPLEFGFGQTTAHPKDGLFSMDRMRARAKPRKSGLASSAHPLGWRISALGLKSSGKGSRFLPPAKRKRRDRLHLANFPGLEEAFGISFLQTMRILSD